MRRVYMAEKSFNGIPQQHQKYIPHFLDNLKTIQTCISHNYEIIRLIIKDAEYMFENKTHEADVKVRLFQMKTYRIKNLKLYQQQII